MCISTSLTYRGKINLVAMQHLNGQYKLQVSSLSKIVRVCVCVCVCMCMHACMQAHKSITCTNAYLGISRSALASILNEKEALNDDEPFLSPV